MRTRRPLILLPIAALLGASALPFPAATAVEKTLPGGTPISVEINNLANGAILRPGPVTLTGKAAVGVGQQPPENTALIYVLDVSGSTDRQVGCAGEQNNNQRPNEILDCEIAATIELNKKAATSGTIDKVGVVVFGSDAAAADVMPNEGDQQFTDPDAPNTDNPFVNTVLHSAVIGGVGQFTAKSFISGTDYGPAITAATAVANATGKPNKLVVFMSDGINAGGPIATPLLEAKRAGVVFKTFAIGTADQQNPVTCGDPNGDTLERIAKETSLDGHGACVPVDNFNELPDIIPRVIEARLTALTLRVDGGPEIPITNVNPPLPHTGTDPVNYLVTTPSLDGGPHRLCVTAKGIDFGGPGSVEDCRSVTVNTPPLVDAGGPYSGLEDNQVPIIGSVADPDSPGLVTSWAVRPLSGVPAGSRCTFADSGRLSTTVSCTERGVYELTLTADDRVNPPVVDRATLTLTNVPPSVSAGGPYKGNEDNQVPVAGKVDDPDGPRLTTTWSIRPTEAVAPGATCTFADPKALSTTVSCTDHGVYVLTLTADDGANPPVANSTTLTLINVMPTVSAGGPYTGEEDHQVPIAGTVVDPDSPGLTTTWSIAAIPGATCAFGDASQLSTVVTCTEPGTYILTLTVNDTVNRPVVVRTTVTLKQTPAALSLIASVDPAPGFVGGDQVTVTYTARNGGPGEMRSVRLTPTLPANPAPAGVSPGACASACDLGTLLAGQSVQVRFTFASNTTADFTVSATVTTTGLDLDATDNTATARVLIRRPTLIVDPGAGAQGFVTRATGRDFPAGARIRLRWSVGLSETPGEVTVRPDGGFDAQVLIFPKDTKGFRTLLAQPVSGPRFGDVLSNPFLVVARPLKPSLFVIR